MHTLSQRERRKFPRRALPSSVKITFEDGTSRQASLMDLSVAGSRLSRLIQTPAIKPKVSRVSFSLNIPELSIREEIASHVAWAHNDELGLSFEKNLLQPKLASFLLEEPNDIKAFPLELTVYLKDTNAFGNTYFARYFDWQGMTREAFLKFLLGDPTPLVVSGIKMITVRAHTEYYHETLFYDQVLIRVHCEKMKHATFDIVFNYFNKNTSQLIATGRQTIAFAGPKGNLIGVPPSLFKALKAYELLPR